ncbi:MAG TPA: AAA family ATPase [Methanoregulaceae archaeon]|nr:AAA family ATPase [Methanoregulaceae archaeon]
MADISFRKRQMKAAAAALTDKHVSERQKYKVVVTGKGGVGKTTLTAILARLSQQSGRKVLAIDEDPQQNLAFSLGYPEKEAGNLESLSHRFGYIREKVGISPGEGYGQPFVLNPDVSDVMERFGIDMGPGLNLLVMGGVEQASSGCLCPENALLESVIRSIRLMEDEAVYLDTQAGLEHFGRAIAGGFGQAVIVTEPTHNALSVAGEAARLARQLKIPIHHLVVNKCRNDNVRDKIRKSIDTSIFTTVHLLPFDPVVWDTEPDIAPLLDKESPFMQEVRRLHQDIIRAGQSLE